MGISGYTANYNLAKYEDGSQDWGGGINNNLDVIDTTIKSVDNKSLTTAQKNGLTDGGYTTLHQHTGIIGVKTHWVLAQQNAFWGDVVWGSTSTVIIRPKASPFGKFIGVVLNTGEYIESTSTITVSLSTNRLNGGIAIQNNAWYILMPYKDSGGSLAFGFSWMPITTFSETNPTNSLTLSQVDSKDIGLCFPEGAELVVFDSSSKLQTPIWYSGGSYDPDGELYIASRTSTVLTLNKNLTIASLAGSKLVYMVSGFQPIDYSTGSITSLIGSNGWTDTGIRIRTDGSGNILPFSINDNILIWESNNSSTYYGYSVASGTISRNTYIPPDAKLVFCRIQGQEGIYGQYKLYYQTYIINVAPAVATGDVNTVLSSIPVLHNLIYARGYSVTIQGYVI